MLNFLVETPPWFVALRNRRPGWFVALRNRRHGSWLHETVSLSFDLMTVNFIVEI
jgi:hypothetical protein